MAHKLTSGKQDPGCMSTHCLPMRSLHALLGKFSILPPPTGDSRPDRGESWLPSHTQDRSTCPLRSPLLESSRRSRRTRSNPGDKAVLQRQLGRARSGPGHHALVSLPQGREAGGHLPGITGGSVPARGQEYLGGRGEASLFFICT